MPQTIINIVLTIIFSGLAIGLIVFVHELGHFLAAKKSGVVVLQFAFGFGPKIWSKKWKGTEYKINLIPLGGYTQMLGDLDGSSFARLHEDIFTPEEDKKIKQIFKNGGVDPSDLDYERIDGFLKSQKSELNKADYDLLKKYVERYYIPRHPGNFENISNPKKVLVLVAGVLMNLLFAVLLFYVYFALNNGYTDLRRIGNPSFLGAEVNTPPILWFDYSTDNIGVSLIVKANGKLVRNIQDLENSGALAYDKPAELYIFNFPRNRYMTINYILDGSGLKSNFDKDFADKIVITQVSDNSAAAVAGIEAGDIVLKFNNVDVTDNIDNLRNNIFANKGKNVDLTITDVYGHNKTVTASLPVVPEGQPVLGVAFNNTNEIISQSNKELLRITYNKYSYLSGILHSINMTEYSFSALGELFKQAVVQKSVAPVTQNVNSILAVPNVFYDVVKGDNYIELINIAALVSLSLAISNILPIPLFDGGHLLFMLIEKIRGKKISPETENKISAIFFYLLVGLSILIIIKDVFQFDWFGRFFSLIGSIFKR